LNRVALCLGGYASGLILAQYLSLPVFSAFSCYGLLFFLLLINKKPAITIFALLIFCLLTGLLRYPAQLNPPESDNLKALLDRGILCFEGEVLATRQRPGGGLVAEIKLLKVDLEPLPLRPESRLQLYLGSMERTLSIGIEN